MPRRSGPRERSGEVKVEGAELGAGKQVLSRFGLYHSLFEWYHPLWLHDKEQTNFTSRSFVEDKMMPELKQLITE